MTILEFTDKQKTPIKISQILANSCEDVRLTSSESIAFMGSGLDGIKIVNIENKSSPNVLETLSLGIYPWMLTIEKYNNYDFLFVTAREKLNFLTLNVTNVNNP